MLTGIPSYAEYSRGALLARACSEEDCGGPWGYEDMKENGEVKNPKYFDLEAANKAVQAVKPTRFESW